MGIALLPSVMTSSHLHAGELREVLPGCGVDGRESFLAYPSRRQLPRAVSAFIEFTLAKMVDEGLVRPVSGHRAAR